MTRIERPNPHRGFGTELVLFEMRSSAGGGLDGALLMPFGLALNIGATALNPAQPVALRVSLKGFPAALNRVLELTK